VFIGWPPQVPKVFSVAYLCSEFCVLVYGEADKAKRLQEAFYNPGDEPVLALRNPYKFPSLVFLVSVQPKLCTLRFSSRDFLIFCIRAYISNAMPVF
jgi:hypothetical protein